MASDEEIIEKDFKENAKEIYNIPNIAMAGITMKTALRLMALARADEREKCKSMCGGLGLKADNETVYCKCFEKGKQAEAKRMEDLIKDHLSEVAGYDKDCSLCALIEKGKEMSQ